jgi:NAD(P)-dependent dehydrogenase (short-subunit alcohol dehydrogenase family)
MSAVPHGAPVALITGGGTGIGAATARKLRADGWEAVICGRRPGPLESVAADCGAVAIPADVSGEDECARLVEQTLERFGRLDGLVLNAGIQRMGTVESLSVKDWNDIFAVNVTGPFLLTRAALPHLLEARGSLVAVASVAALRSASGMAGYGASKAALLSLVQNIAMDYAPRGLRANVVCPGWTRSELADEEMRHIGGPRGLSVEESYQFVTSLVPLRRPAESEEVGNAIAWLLSSQSSYVNAAVLTVDGGHVALDPGTVPFDPRVRITPES